ncbi:MAG TPA: hypothetical protein VMF52_16065, partial [Steroidobacteraceae bacterium]|nr:hypothetical protein [Steroidobacteraceae bacterium]
GAGFHIENAASLSAVPFHTLDETVNGLFDIMPGEIMAAHAALCFRAVGAGSRALALWIKATGDGGIKLAQALEGPLATDDDIAVALRLLETCVPPNDDALHRFIENHVARLTPAQRVQVMRLSTWPVRTKALEYTQYMAASVVRHFPEADEVRQMWCRWIREGQFDAGRNPEFLADLFAGFDKHAVADRRMLDDELCARVKRLARAGDLQSLDYACNYVRAAHAKRLSCWRRPYAELTAAPGTAEWDRWRELHPEDEKRGLEFIRKVGASLGP